MKTINELKEIIRTNLNVVFYDDMLTVFNELEKYKRLEEQGRLIEFPCKAGDYAKFPNGNILPVISVTSCNNDDINIRCQNGTIISMKHTFKAWGVQFISKEEYESL